jgi:predicted transcriptional regulator
MLGAVSARLGQEKVRQQFAPTARVEDADAGSFSARLTALASERRLSLLLCLSKRPRTVSELARLCGFDGAIAAEDLELLSRQQLVKRNNKGVWTVCCAAVVPAVERLVHLVLTTPSTREAT